MSENSFKSVITFAPSHFVRALNIFETLLFKNVLNFFNLSDQIILFLLKFYKKKSISQNSQTLIREAFKTKINGKKIIVSAPTVLAPTQVRFAWDETAQPNLFNNAGLPAIPFRTNQ
jgi:hypothetical protein